MKISGSRPSAPAAKTEKTGAGAPLAAPAAAQPVDETILAGIPAGELTPRVREVLITLITEVQDLRAELSAARGRMRELENLADTDPLVGINNRRAFVRELERVLAMVDRYHVPASLVFIDLNDLKKINDERGHNAGDAALKTIADVLSAHVRQTDVVGRLGGDEFAVILTHLDEAAAQAKAEALAELIASEEVVAGEARFRVSISFGLAPIAQGHSADQTMENADSAMYSAKRAR